MKKTLFLVVDVFCICLGLEGRRYSSEGRGKRGKEEREGGARRRSEKEENGRIEREKVGSTTDLQKDILDEVTQEEIAYKGSSQWKGK